MYKIFNSDIDTSLLDKISFKFQQRLFEDPALKLENIRKTIPEIKKDLIYFSGRKMRKDEDFEHAITEGRKDRPIEEIIENLATSNAYIMIREPESHHAFRKLHHDLVEDITKTIKTRGHGTSAIDPRSYLFISSPSSITPFHFDRASNFLFQIAGSKEVTTFPTMDERVITQLEYESHFEREGGAVKWKPQSESLGTTHHCGPGDALHIPFAAGHHVKNGPEVSVTLSIFFNDTRTQTQINAMKFNHRVRKKARYLSDSLSAVGKNHTIDYMKSLAYRSYTRLGR